MRRRLAVGVLAAVFMIPTTAANAQPPTWFGVTAVGHRITHIKIITYRGFTRRVEIFTDGRRVHNFNVRQNSTITLRPTDLLTADCSVRAKITEDIPGPFNIVSSKTLKVC